MLKAEILLASLVLLCGQVVVWRRIIQRPEKRRDIHGMGADRTECAASLLDGAVRPGDGDRHAKDREIEGGTAAPVMGATLEREALRRR